MSYHPRGQGMGRAEKSPGAEHDFDPISIRGPLDASVECNLSILFIRVFNLPVGVTLFDFQLQPISTGGSLDASVLLVSAKLGL